jgi:hypothetical protein
MDWSEEVQAAHRSLSEADFKFREFARQDPESLNRATYALFDEKKYAPVMVRLQSWPTFVGAEKLAELRRASSGLSRLVRAIPERIFGNDPVRMGEFYALSPDDVEQILAPPNGIAAALSRADFIDSDAGFQCLEFNFVANLGGWETPIMAGLHQQVPATVRYLREAGLHFSYTDTLKVLLVHVIGEVQRLGLGREGSLNVAFVTPNVPLALDWLLPIVSAELVSVLRRRGSPLAGKALFCRPWDLHETEEGLWLGTVRIHAVVELPSGGGGAAAVRRFKAGQVALLNGPIDKILGGKHNLGLLSELQDSGRFTPEEREILERHLPWTRIVAPGRVRYCGEETSLPDFVVARRESLVLKASTSYGGKDVAIGRSTPEDAWLEVLRRALGGERWIVQEYVESRPLLFQCGEHGCAPHAVIWGPFVFGDKYAGAFLRMQPVSVEGPVNISASGSAGLVLEV